MKDENYIVIHGWMVNRLKLSGVEKEIYAIIYGFSQDGESKFTGSLKYLMEWTGAGRTSVIRYLKNLEERGLITKHVSVIKGVTFNAYTSNVTYASDEQGGANLVRGGTNLVRGGGTNLAPNNIELKEKNNIGSCNDDAFFDDLFFFETAPKEVSDRIAKEALAHGLEEDALGQFAEYINGMHFKIRGRARIRGLKDVVKNFKRA